VTQQSDFDLTDYFNLGNILVRRGVVTDRQVRKALKLQKKRGGATRLGECLVELGFCDADAVRAALKAQEEQSRGVPERKTAGALERLALAVDDLEGAAEDLRSLGKRGVLVLDVSDDKSGTFPISQEVH